MNYLDSGIWNQDSLIDALGVGEGSFVAAVGAGGKSSLLGRLGRELVQRGLRVLTSSTTNLQPPRPGQTDEFLIFDNEKNFMQALAGSFKNLRHVTLAGSDIRKDKVKGVSPEVLVELYQARAADVFLIQADGARKRSFKAPAEHEPVIPSCATHCVLMVGLDVLGQPLSERKVHRPEVTARLAGQPLGSVVTLETVVRVVEHPESYRSRIPVSARRILFLSKADSPERVQSARAIASRISPDYYPTILWGDLSHPVPSSEGRKCLYGFPPL